MCTDLCDKTTTPSYHFISIHMQNGMTVCSSNGHKKEELPKIALVEDSHVKKVN